MRLDAQKFDSLKAEIGAAGGDATNTTMALEMGFTPAMGGYIASRMKRGCHFNPGLTGKIRKYFEDALGRSILLRDLVLDADLSQSQLAESRFAESSTYRLAPDAEAPSGGRGDSRLSPRAPRPAASARAQASKSSASRPGKPKPKGGARRNARSSSLKPRGRKGRRTHSPRPRHS